MTFLEWLFFIPCLLISLIAFGYIGLIAHSGVKFIAGDDDSE